MKHTATIKNELEALTGKTWSIDGDARSCVAVCAEGFTLRFDQLDKLAEIFGTTLLDFTYREHEPGRAWSSVTYDSSVAGAFIISARDKPKHAVGDVIEEDTRVLVVGRGEVRTCVRPIVAFRADGKGGKFSGETPSQSIARAIAWVQESKDVDTYAYPSPE